MSSMFECFQAFFFLFILCRPKSGSSVWVALKGDVWLSAAAEISCEELFLKNAPQTSGPG